MVLPDMEGALIFSMERLLKKWEMDSMIGNYLYILFI